MLTLNDGTLSQRPTWQKTYPLLAFHVDPPWHATCNHDLSSPS